VVARLPVASSVCALAIGRADCPGSHLKSRRARRSTGVGTPGRLSFGLGGGVVSWLHRGDRPVYARVSFRCGGSAGAHVLALQALDGGTAMAPARRGGRRWPLSASTTDPPVGMARHPSLPADWTRSPATPPPSVGTQPLATQQRRWVCPPGCERMSGFDPKPHGYRLDRGGNRQLNLALHRFAVNRALVGCSRSRRLVNHLAGRVEYIPQSAIEV
jgi:hypothetical protein